MRNLNLYIYTKANLTWYAKIVFLMATGRRQ